MGRVGAICADQLSDTSRVGIDVIELVHDGVELGEP